MSIVDKAASRRGRSDRSSLVERAMSRRSGAVNEGPADAAAAPPTAGAAASREPEVRPVDPQVASQVPPQAAPAGDPPPRPSRAAKVSERFHLDWEAMERKRLIGNSRHARRLQEEIRTIKSRFMSSVDYFDVKRRTRGCGGENVVLVTSARQGEGKSFTSINLALSLALEDRIPVLLVDADAVHAAVTGFFGLGRERRGLLDRLADPTLDLSEVLMRAEGTALSVLPVGRRAQAAADLYAGPTMARLLDELSNRYADRLIIFDAPPLLATHEPVALSKQIQQVLLIVEAGKTTEATIRTALEVLGQRVRVNLVLNHCTIKGEEVQTAGYGYGAAAAAERVSSRGREAA